MSDVDKQISMKFRLKSISNISFSYKNISEKYKKKLDDVIILNISYRFDVKEKKDEAHVYFQVSMVNKETEIEVANIQIKYNFHIIDIKKFTPKPNTLFDSVLLMIFSVSYSTFRGQVYEKLRGTPLENLAPLNLVDPNTLLKGMQKDKNP